VKKQISLFAGVAAAVLLWCAPAFGLAVRVNGNHLVDASGNTLQLRGVSRSGTEYMCATSNAFFDGPSSNRSIAAMRRWKMNTVRVPLNEDCWLGINRVPAAFGGLAYQAVIENYVARLHAAGFYVVIDMHTAAPDGVQSLDIDPMADADHAIDFWHSVATAFKADPAVLFDAYNEPNPPVDWPCLLHGCTIPAGNNGAPHPAYTATGMQQLVDAIRSVGATQPIMIAGVNYSNDISRWLEFEPNDPLHQLAASEHNYGPHFSPCVGACQAALAAVASQVPVIAGELGENDCKHRYIDKWMSWADAHGISYLGWAWDAVHKGGWNCKLSPALILNYKGKPTGFGVGFRNHFRKVARR
jgi:endoglucanase